MKYIRLLPALLWRVLFFTNLVLTLFIFYPFFYIFLSNKNWFKYAFRLKKIWAHFITFDVGVFYKINRSGKVNPEQTYVYCPNHTSYLDIMMSYIAIPQYFSFVGKAALEKIPLFGIFFKRKMDISIKRESLKASFSAIETAGSYLDQGISISIFPEGTISGRAPHLLNFKNGPFKLAISRQVPIVPIVFHNNYKILPHEKDYFRSGPGIARVSILDPIPTTGMNENDDIERLKTLVREAIDNALGNHKRQKVSHHE